MKHFYLLAWLFLAVCSSIMGQALNPHVDNIFAEWDKAASPGCALAVVRNGAVVYKKGYGIANLELNVPITTKTVFDIGSVSKQFTAMSVVLLAKDRKLSLDDEIHKFIPELPDYGVPVTLRRMLNHLSGLRSYTDLFDLAGIPEINLTTDDDALRLMARQKTLNFAPGQQYLYSDTNYFFLSLVVERVSGQSLREFARQRIFEPLGMASTHFHNDHTMIVPQRATGYAPHAGGGFEIDMSNYEELGDGSVMTTVEDMVLWDQNFYKPVVGGQSALDELQRLGIRTDGRKTSYGMGLILDHYRGLPRVQHSGEWVGYRSGFIRFPEQQFSVIALCNVIGDLDTLALTERVADVYLNDQFPKSEAPRLAHLPVPPQELKSYVGSYWDAKTFAFLKFATKEGDLAAMSEDSVQPLFYIGSSQFQAQSSPTRYVFRHSNDGALPQVAAVWDDTDPVVLEKVSDARLKPEDALSYVGTYYNNELGVSWTLEVKNGQLIRKQWMFPAQILQPIFADTFVGDLSEGKYTLQFTRDAAHHLTGFAVATSMVRPTQFTRCEDVSPLGGISLSVDCKFGTLPSASQQK